MILKPLPNVTGSVGIIAVASLVAATSGIACRTATAANQVKPQSAPIVQPGAPGQPSQVISPEKAADLSHVQYTGADIKFMQGMIGHHQQAVEMVAMVPQRTSWADLKMLAKRIDLSQQDEMGMMEHWLQVRGQQVPARTAMHMHGATLMPGMLTPDEMKQLQEANGSEFDRLFLEGMIKHHGGALTMVKDLMGTAGAAQESEIFAFASDVEADQTMEIDRMAAMLEMVKERKR